MLRNDQVLKQQMPDVLQTIRQGPSHRPLGRGACYEFEAQPEAKTPGIAKQPFLGSAGFKVSRYSAENPFTPVKRAPGVVPLSLPEIVGNVGDAAPQGKPIWDTPISAAWEAASKSMAHQEAQKRMGIAAEFHRSQGFGVSQPGPLHEMFNDYTEAAENKKRDESIRTAIKNGFTAREANEAYDEIRKDFAKEQMFSARNPNNKLIDILDSKFGGTQNGEFRSNDESALFLAERQGLKNFTMGSPQPLGGNSKGGFQSLALKVPGLRSPD